MVTERIEQRSDRYGAPGDEYERFCQSVKVYTGLDLTLYKRNQMERRIRAMADRAGATGLLDFWKKISHDPQVLREFLDRVTINVSELFRNPEKFEELRRVILPPMLRRQRNLFVWSAGCSYGAEPFTLRILLHQLSPFGRHRILATDIDAGVLDRARQAIFSEEDLKNIDDAMRQRYFRIVEKGYQIIPSLQQGVEFQRQDLLRDPFPESADLILCRNVVIYFTDEAKDRLFRRFFAALRPGGFLMIGSTERIEGAGAIGYHSTLPFFYQRPLTD